MLLSIDKPDAAAAVSPLVSEGMEIAVVAALDVDEEDDATVS